MVAVVSIATVLVGCCCCCCRRSWCGGVAAGFHFVAVICAVSDVTFVIVDTGW